MNSDFCTLTVRDELELLEINHPLFSASILKQGAQLISYKPKHDSDWIWLSKLAEFKQGKSVRGGIPICWPWFGNIDDNPQSVQSMVKTMNVPAHGFARTRLWELSKITETDTLIALEFLLDIETSDSWYGQAQLELKVKMRADSLSLNLVTHSKAKPIFISQALHTYFPTQDIQQTSLAGFENLYYYDALDNWHQKTQEDEVIFSSEVDRVYLGESKQRLKTPNKTFILKSNSKSSVVWNPWIEKSKRLSQFADDSWQSMFCVETANVMEDCIELAPYSSHALTMSITTENLNE